MRRVPTPIPHPSRAVAFVAAAFLLAGSTWAQGPPAHAQRTGPPSRALRPPQAETSPEGRRPPAVVGERRSRHERGRPASGRDDESRWGDDDGGDRRYDRRDEPYDERHRRREPYVGPRGRGERPGGPPFCRNGSGHPVFGMQWCRERGFAPKSPGWRVEWDVSVRWGGRYRRPQFRRWPALEGAHLRIPRARTQPLRSPRSLRRVLGRQLYHRLHHLTRRQHRRRPSSGLWTVRRGEGTLRVRSGRRPLAVLVDRNGDRHVDLALVASPERRW